MVRANRHFVPGHIWHLTHRCHKREFLLNFPRIGIDGLIFYSKPKSAINYPFWILSSPATISILLISNQLERTPFPERSNLVAGRLGQEYNRRKNRKGAFWEDRYHAIAIETGDHLWRCLVYIDLKVVRAGVVGHPSEWKWGGSHENRNPKTRYRLIDLDLLKQLLDIDGQNVLVETHQRWIDRQLADRPTRQEHHSKSITVGNKAFVEKIYCALKSKAIGRRVREVSSQGHPLRETTAKFGDVESDYAPLTISNSIPWQPTFS